MFNMKLVFTFLSLLFFIPAAFCQTNAYEVTVKLENFEGSELYMAQYYGNRPYLMDTVQQAASGEWVFRGEEALSPGMYFIVLPPANDFLQFVLSEKEQTVEIMADVNDLQNSIRVRESLDNELFYEYLRFVEERQGGIQKLNAQIDKEKAQGNNTTQLEAQRNARRDEIKVYKRNLHDKYPQTVTARMTYADLETPVPEFEGEDEEDVNYKKFYFRRAHYFDFLDPSSEVLLRCPVLQKKTDFYIDRMTPQVADSLILALDRILTLAESGSENFQYLFVQYINEYGQSQTLGFDKIFVHLVDNYVRTGKAEFLEPDVQSQLLERASKMKPLLIGKPAPDLTVMGEDSTEIRLHDIEADYLVLVFWKPDCPTCQKAAPYLVDFYDKYKEQNVKVFGLCVSQGEEKSAKCWEYARQKGYDTRFINAIDPYNRSRFYQKYDIRSTPRIMILNKDKKILVNMCGAQQLGEILETVREREEKVKSEE